MGDEQRRHKRRSLRVEFRGRDAEGSGELFLQGADLSPGGAFLRSDLLLETDETLTLEFQVPGVPPTLRVNARVAWVRRFPKADEQPGMGVEFISMNAEDAALLERYLRDDP